MDIELMKQRVAMTIEAMKDRDRGHCRKCEEKSAGIIELRKELRDRHGCN